MSIKLKQKTKKKIEKKQAELQLEHSIKITQTELLEKIVDKAIDEPQFIENLLGLNQDHSIPLSKKQIVDVKVIATSKLPFHLYPDEWED
jgi:hypothetical protein